MKRETAFTMLANNRQASKPFAVVAVTKAGTPSKVKPSKWMLASTEAEATAIKERVERLNPNVAFAIIRRTNG